MSENLNYEINIPKIIKSIPESNIIERILYESILNSIHSNSQLIRCEFSFSNEHLFSEDSYRDLDSLKVIDDGDGFTEKNLKSFKTYSSDYKTKKWGAKGTGRFSFLKCCNNVYYESDFFNGKEYQRRKINFNITGLTTESLESKNKKETILYLKGFSLKLNINSILKNIVNVVSKIYPTLSLIKTKERNRNLNIEFYNNGESIYNISLDSVISLKRKVFKIKDKVNSEEHKFELFYFLDKNMDSIVQESGYCADYVKVKDFDLKIKLKNISYVFYLYSEYFDNATNDERNEFIGINPKEKTLNKPITWEMINESLKDNLNSILIKEDKNIGRDNEILLETIKSAYPFLDDFIDLKVSNVIGYLNKSDILKSGYTKIDQIKNNLRHIRENFIDNQDLNEEDLDELIQKSSLDLAEYITNRQVILDSMQTMIDKNENIEDNIHNLIMPMRTKGSTKNKRYETCNLWLLDDKFMSFSNAMSDKSIKESISEINKASLDFEGSKQEPDLIMYFNNDKNKDKLVMIEFKSFSTSHRNKYSGVSQLLEYIEIINKNMRNVKERWYYLITTIDTAFSRELERNNFKSIFSNKQSGYFQYYNDELIQSNIYVLDMESLIYDSNIRNKAFMDIFKEGFVNSEK